MAWSEAARAAALEVRRQKAKQTVAVGVTKRLKVSRSVMAMALKLARADARHGPVKWPAGHKMLRREAERIAVSRLYRGERPQVFNGGRLLWTWVPEKDR